MQMGARWQHGAVPHRSVPSALHSAISDAETAFPGGDSWTLTWLEGRPRAILDDLVELRVDAHGAVETTRIDGSRGAAAPEAGPGAAATDDDDDDWLN